MVFSRVPETLSEYRPQKDALEVFEDGTDKARAQTNVQTAISKYPDAGVYLGLWSYNAHFIAEELAKFPDLRKKTTIVTFDLDEAAVDDLARGAIDVTVCQNPYQIGYLGVRLLKAYIAKDQKTIDEMLPAAPTASTPASASSSRLKIRRSKGTM